MLNKSIYILGLNFTYHELAACIIKDGKLIAAVEEERFSRIKRGKSAIVSNPNILPIESIKYCLKVAGIQFKDIDHVGFSFDPEGRLKNINSDSYKVKEGWGSEKGEKLFHKKINEVPDLLNKLAGIDMRKKVFWLPHHKCHAASTFFVSPFKESAVLTIDGIGEFSSTWMGYGTNNSMSVIKEVFYPNSVGFLWEKMSQYMGFTEYDSSKVMGLAAYGNSKRFYKIFQKIVKLLPNGEFSINGDIMLFRIDDFTPLEKLFSVKKIISPKDITKDQQDISAALQKITNDVIMHVARFIKEKTGSNNICLAGGVALNCVSNGVLMKSGLYKNIYIQPAANDAGTALGAADYIWNQILCKGRNFAMDHVYWGPGYTDKEIQFVLDKTGVKYKKVSSIEKETALKLTEGNIIGWFQGRVEWGPRALGGRSLLADPRRSDMKNILNERIKRREPFRPFAPSVLKEEASNWFIIPKKCNSISTEFMEINFDVKENKRKKIPAVTHADGTSRVQLVNKKTNPSYYRLIDQFYKITKVPMLLNTSFNDNEPIVCSPEDAVKTFLRTKMDYLAIGNYLVSKR